MAVTFASSFYDGPTSEKQRAETWMGPQYGVRGAGDWKVTAVTGQDRTVTIASGSGFGHGLADTTLVNDTLQLDPITSGSRWDLIAVRRNWQPVNGGPTSFVKIAGSSVKGFPAVGTAATAWNRRPGIMDDQPIALCRVTAGQTAVQEIVDLRCWASNGGLVIADKLALNYLATLGARVLLGGTEYRCIPDLLDFPVWESRETMYREWNAETTVTTVGAGGTKSVNFPSGMFTVAPLVQATKQGAQSAKYIPYVTAVTTTGCTVGLYSGDGSGATTTTTVAIRAVQTSPDRATGVNP